MEIPLSSGEQCALGEHCAKHRKREAFQNRLTFRRFGQLHTRKLTGVALTPNDKQVTHSRIIEHFPLNLQPSQKRPVLLFAATAWMDRHIRLGQSGEDSLCLREILG